MIFVQLNYNLKRKNFILKGELKLFYGDAFQVGGKKWQQCLIESEGIRCGSIQTGSVELKILFTSSRFLLLSSFKKNNNKTPKRKINELNRIQVGIFKSDAGMNGPTLKTPERLRKRAAT